jgi:hypothetical protein
LYDFIPGTHQWSSFAGMEIGFRVGGKSLFGLPRTAVVLRTEQFVQAVDRNRFGKGGDYGGHYSVGARFDLLNRNGFIVRPQAGYGWTFEQRTQNNWYYEDLSLVTERKRPFVNYGWWYVRPSVNAPLKTYAEGFYKHARPINELAGNVSIEPWRLYARGSWDRTIRSKQTRRELAWPPDTNRIGQVRLGIRPLRPWLVFVLWEDQKYDSPVWLSRAWGLGPGSVYEFSDHFKIQADAKFLNHFVAKDKVYAAELERSLVPRSDPRWKQAVIQGKKREYRLGMVYSW